MTRPASTTSGLRRPIAVASVLALTSGLAMGFAPAVGAAGNGGNGGNGSTRPPAPNGAGGRGGAGGMGTAGHGGNGGNGGAGGLLGTGPIDCTDDNLDLLARATGGVVHAVEQDDNCLVIHRFTANGSFTITSRPGFPLQILVVGAGGGAGGGSGWEDSLKVSGAVPESGAGAGGAGGTVRSGDVAIDSTTGAFTYTPTDVENIDGSYIYAPGATQGSAAFTDPAGRTLTAPVIVGNGGNGGNGGTSTSGSSVGGQGGNGGDSSFGEFTAIGGGGGFGGRGGNGGAGDAQNSLLGSLRAGGQRGGSNGVYSGGDIGIAPTLDHAAPGGAGATENGHLPVAVGSAGNGGDGGAGVVVRNFFSNDTSFGDGGGGGTTDPDAPPYAAVVGGNGGRGGLLVGASSGGRGENHGGGEDAPDGFGGGGGGGGTDGSVTPGDSNAGKGGRGGDGVVYVRYAALAAPGTPAVPSAVAGDGSVTLTITPLAETPDYYMLWVAGDPTRTCMIYPPETSCVIEGLDNGEDYTFLAYAGNSAGESDTSAESLVVTPSADLLPYTGSSSRNLAALALTMIGLGGAGASVARRRRTIG